MDLETLFLWRVTCRTNYLYVADTFKRTLRCMLTAFVQCIDQFLDALTECRGVIGGEFALSYILRDPDFVPARLEIFVGDAEFQSFLDLLDLSTELSHNTMLIDIITTTHAFTSDRAIGRVAPILTTTGLFIWVYEADCISACSAVGRS